jgi:hypothetical protein
MVGSLLADECMKDDFRMGILLDFNTAAILDRPDALNNKERIDRVRAEVESCAIAVLQHLLPGGRISGSEYEAGDITGIPGNSLKVNIGKSCVWSDFATGHKGADLIDLWKASRKCSFNEAIDQIEEYLYLKPVPRSVPHQKSKPRELGPPTHTYYYRDQYGNITASVTRYDPKPGEKEFIPWDVKTRKHTHPTPRPLYNQPGILNEKTVVLVEGEKCADALISAGIPATTAMGGAKAPTDKTDWTPLRGKEVIVWPDNDEPGRQYAQAAKATIESVGGAARVLTIPEGKPAKWDAADAVAEDFDVKGFLGTAVDTKKRFSVFDWEMCAYQGDAPERQWLVNCTFPMASVSILAAMGDAGKGMLSLDLGLKIACDFESDLLNPHPIAFGNSVLQRGSVVILSAEDDRDEIHRRLAQIDTEGKRFKSKNKLIVVPLPNAGGPAPIVVPGRNGPEITSFFLNIREQLLSVPNLKLVVFDPMACFVMADITKDPAAGSYTTGLLANLATETGASIIVAHHMNKGAGDKGIHGPEQARDRVRGTSAIVDGVRSVYCLWPMEPERAKRTCKTLNIEFLRNKVFAGAIVKSNGPADREVKTFVRQQNGLLMVVDEILRTTKLTNEDLKEIIVEDIRRMALAGRPFAFSGQAGLYERREELSPELRGVGRNRIHILTNELLDNQRIGKSIAPGSKTPKWLDVPGGPFQIGSGKFEPGFEHDDAT